MKGPRSLLLEPLESRLLMARTAGIDVSHWQGTINGHPSPQPDENSKQLFGDLRI
jgi:hypothetical protein